MGKGTHTTLNLFDQGTSILLTDIPINLSETVNVKMNTISERGVYTDTSLTYPANVSHETTQESICPGPEFSSIIIKEYPKAANTLFFNQP